MQQWTMATTSGAKISTREMRAMRTSGGMEKQDTCHRRQVSANPKTGKDAVSLRSPRLGLPVGLGPSNDLNQGLIDC
jgi:hypothetical protein